MLQPDEKPDISYADIGGMDMQKQEVPLTLNKFCDWSKFTDLLNKRQFYALNSVWLYFKIQKLSEVTKITKYC